ncbi:glycosyltransferase family 4 protein [Streptomyces sp. NBC_01210]|uniref:glycosyltransferase family 4 protein n=1 Tax=Streptomyces sp. NBC_01210 TaxID=2903774 RepID=UPI002E13BE8F|nr:glycosyltransferase family 4 protein [Streptomyces sp. NBC_01210]
MSHSIENHTFLPRAEGIDPTMPLTVLHVLVPEPPGEVGGADLHVIDLAAQQVADGHRAMVVERGSTEFADRVRETGLDVVSATGHSFLSAVRLLAQKITATDADIIHAHGYDADYWAAAARILYPRVFSGRPLVLTQHGVVDDTLWHKSKTALDVLCARTADGIIATAENLVPRMRKWCPRGSVAYIPNGVRQLPRVPKQEARVSLAERYGVPLAGELIAYVGRLSEEKAPERVLTLVAQARATGRKVHALVVGSGPMDQQLKSQADELGIADAVTFTGIVRDVETVYGAIDAFVLLSCTETTSRVVIEAMTSGIPVVASAVGGIPQLLDSGECGVLVPSGDENAALAGLIRVLDAPEPYIEPARHRALSSFAISTMGSGVEDFYSTLLARHQRGVRTRSATSGTEG